MTYDAEGNVTRYAYSDRDLLTREESPVSGVTDSVYNEHGELEDETDARGVTVHRDYDALDRLLTVSYPDPSLDVTYSYDAPGLFARGRLTGITRHGETIAYDYDRFGRMTRDGALTYAYDDNGNRTGIDYPDAVSVIYTYDYADRQKTLALSVDGSAPATLADNATYKPFGPLASLSLANGLTETRSYGQRYQPEGIRLDGAFTLFNWSYTVDLIGNITAIEDVLTPANNRSYGYQDNVYFLTQGNGPWGLRAWTYDRIGNRLTESRGAVTDSYVYPANSSAGHNPKLQSITLGTGGSRSYGYDAVGTTIQIVDANQQLDLIHDASRRLTELISRPEDRYVSLAYDGRSFLSEAGDDEAGCFPKKTFVLYDSEGLLHRREHHLIDGASTVFLDSDTVLSFAGRPLAVLNLTPSTSKLTYLTTDHLGTPAAASSESGGLLWQGGFEPFGATWNVPDAAVFLRFPGQWSDEKWNASSNNFFYNTYRWYKADTARYSQPDPLEIGASLQLYGYANANPLRFTDPLGLKVELYCGLIGQDEAATIGHQAAGAAGYQHCFVRIKCNCPKYDLRLEVTGRNDKTGMADIPSPQDFSGGHGGTIVPFDSPDWDSDDCKMEECINQHYRDLQQQGYPYGAPPKGWLLGPNSNTFADSLLRSCGVQNIDWPKGVTPFN